MNTFDQHRAAIERITNAPLTPVLACRIIDALVTEHVLHDPVRYFESTVYDLALRTWQPAGMPMHRYGNGGYSAVPFYTLDAAATMALMRHIVRSGFAAWIEGDGHTGWQAGCTGAGATGVGVVRCEEWDAEHPGLALCRAALAAHGCYAPIPDEVATAEGMPLRS